MVTAQEVEWPTGQAKSRVRLWAQPDLNPWGYVRELQPCKEFSQGITYMSEILKIAKPIG